MFPYKQLINHALFLFFTLHRNDSASESKDACRIHGHIHVSKVAGNFHITLGK